MMRIVVDENIPYAEEAFGAIGRVESFAGRGLRPAVVRDADVLLVRSVTRVDAALLRGSRVRFVGSATIGTDHVDLDYLRSRGIGFAHAPGSNADSVVEYIVAALLGLAVGRGEGLRGKVIGIIGCGNIGGRLVARLPALGLRVLKNDPPLAARAEADGKPHDFVSLDAVLAQSDMITLHVPLAKQGHHATHHLIDSVTLRSLKPGSWLLNSSRGAVVSNKALNRALRDQQIGGVVLDVWENEPTPDAALLALTDLATPHIAGYSFDGKVQGTVMLYEALCEYFGIAPRWSPEAVLAPVPEDRLQLVPPDPDLPEALWLHRLVAQMYDIARDDAALRKMLDLPVEERGAYFSRLRKAYPRRRTFSRFRLPRAALPARCFEAVTVGLGIGLAD